MASEPTPEGTRRPDIPALPCVLADGRTWYLARPAVRLAPRVVRYTDAFGREREEIEVIASQDHPVQIQRLLVNLEHAIGQGSPESQQAAFFELAAAMLRRAHDIDLDTALQLLAIDIEDLPRVGREVLTIALDGSSQEPDDSGELRHE